MSAPVMIPLAKGGFSIVDAEDAERILAHNWHISGGYAATNIRRDGAKTTITMHRFILNARPGQFVDHADRCKLNNQKSNLRFCTEAQNASNRASALPSTTGLRGVRVEAAYSLVKYRAEIRPKGRKIRGPRRDDPIQAALDYDQMAIDIFGPFAFLNFPEASTGARP